MLPQQPNPPSSSTPPVEETVFPASQQGASATELILGCPCGQRLKVARSAAGKQVRCPVCSRLLQVAVTQSPTLPPIQDARATLPPQNRLALEETLQQGHGHVPTGASTTPHVSGSVSTASAIKRFGDYEILGEIARGGMGVVYKARQVSLNRVVALKMILAGQLSSRDAIERFQREARASATLDHPNIVPVYEVGEIDNQHFFSMGFVSGGSLQGLVQKGPLPPREAARLVRLTAEAVQHAHEHGVIHRDLKPHNVLMSDEAASAGDRASLIPKLTDFGLARIASEGGLSVTGDVMGTPSYMPPEQARGELKEIGPAADIYSLGAVLYCLLTGRPPFQAATPMETMMLAVTKEPLPPRELNPHVPRDLETVCLKCLEKVQGRRYPTAKALAEELGRCERGEPVQARPVSMRERTWRWCLRNKAVAGLLLAVMLSLLTGTIVSVAFAIESRNNEAKAIEREGKEREAREAEEIAKKNEKEQKGKAIEEKNKAVAEYNRAEGEKKRAETELEKARANLFTGQLLRVGSHWQREPVLGLQLLMDEELCPPSRRDSTWHLLRRLCHRRLWGSTGSSQFLQAVALSPDGKTVASTWALGVELWEAETGKRLHAPALQGLDGGEVSKYVRCLAWYPDSKALLVGCGDGTIRAIDPAEGKETARLKEHEGKVVSLAFSPDGTTFASAAEDKTIKLWDAAKRTVKQTLTGHTRGVTALAYHPGGKTLVSGSADETFRVWDLGTGESRAVRARNTVKSLVFHPDGKTFLAAQHVLTRWDAATGEMVEELSDYVSPNAVALSKDGKSFASASIQGWLHLGDGATGKLLLTLHTGGMCYGTAFSADGNRVFTSDSNHVSAWDARRDRPPIRLLDPGEAACAAFSADGRTLATGGLDGQVRRWDLAAETMLPPLHVANFPVYRLALSPDGVSFTHVSRGALGTLSRLGLDMKDRFELGGHQSGISQIAYSPDGLRLASAGSDGRAIVWDLKQRKQVDQRYHRGFLTREVAFSPNGKMVAVMLDNADRNDAHKIELWDPDAKTARVVVTLPHTSHDSFVSMAFSPDGKSLLIGTNRGKLYLWDVADGKELAMIGTHTNMVHAVGFIGDGSTLFSYGMEGVLKFWDAPTRQQRAAFTVSNFLCASKDGKRIATTNGTGVIQVWDATPFAKP